jgi:hypothetical protein
VSISHRFSLGVFGEEKLRADNVTVKGVNRYWKIKGDKVDDEGMIYIRTVMPMITI